MFTHRMSRPEKECLYQTASMGAKIFDATGIAWWMSHGTLLGAWRHRDVIPWDDDLDFAFPMEDLPSLVGRFRMAGWEYRRIKPFLAKVWNPQGSLYSTNHPWTWPSIDIALYDKKSSIIKIEFAYHTRFSFFEERALLPIKPIPFGPLLLPAPKDPPVLLDAIYPKWSTTPTSSRFSHRFEKPYEEPAERDSIENLRKIFSIYNVGCSSIS